MPISSEFDHLILEALKQQHGDQVDQLVYPPPVFVAMQGEFLEIDLENASVRVRFPILKSWLNPYGIMQGGMVAAAIDNTIGPLGALVASANVTRTMNVKYSRSATLEMQFILVNAWLLERDGRWLTFKAEAKNPGGQRLARAHARHWILDP